ncbi:putative lipid phosphate phosphatase 3, chloroplastic [Cyphellophora attinorum]|uniref:Putative lipid phosphate phosphatase 3, chloroplastic n=1 Tax=Cyphellophora attinorum TaxID=1664694 RepID=A0A0N1H9Q3_9EURO|nr:putative lipid phosphate phosphatase 3, chloroplastic [Phialophora attinorum]KPI44464.1 putative lipid phosphate phosphatase 3, chloroplastic [Phialophora attinorum]
MASITARIRQLPCRLILSYVLDWIIVFLILGLAGAFNSIDAKNTRHAFSLQDPNISFPHKPDLVSNGVLYVTSIILPAIIIALICVFAVPGWSAARSFRSRQSLWRRKVWELNVGWLGICLAVFSAITITEGLKAAANKPRPHLLSVCDPDLSSDAIEKWRVGGLGGTDLSTATAPIIVTWQICRNEDKDEMRNAFASWPSGHASTSWAGLLYLTLRRGAPATALVPESTLPTTNAERGVPQGLRHKAAAPPMYLVLLAAVPIGTAFFISLSRWFDYRHHGFDIISGAVIGIFCAWISFGFYQVPISLSNGWAWAPRSQGHEFGLLVGDGRGYGELTEDERQNVGSTGESVSLGKLTPRTDIESQSQSQASSGSSQANRGVVGTVGTDGQH